MDAQHPAHLASTRGSVMCKMGNCDPLGVGSALPTRSRSVLVVSFRSEKEGKYDKWRDVPPGHHTTQFKKRTQKPHRELAPQKRERTALKLENRRTDVRIEIKETQTNSWEEKAILAKLCVNCVLGRSFNSAMGQVFQSNE